MNASETINAIVERAWQYRLANDAYQQVRHGIPVAHVRANTLGEAEADSAFARGLLAELSSTDAGAVSHEDWLTLAFLAETLQQQADAPALWWASFPVTPYQLYGLNVIGQAVFAPFRFDTAADGERYLGLLHDYARIVQTLQARLQDQAQRDWRVPRPVPSGVRATLNGIRAAAPKLLGVEGDRLQKVAAGVGDTIQEEIRKIQSEEIEPAFDALIASVGHDYEKLAPEGVGLSQFPGGEQAYRLLVRANVTYDIEPGEVHRIGLEQVAQLTDEMRRVREGLGFHGGETEFIDQLKASGHLHARSPEDVEARYRRAIARLVPLLSNYFSTLPKAPYDVRRLPSALEAGMTYGYYEAPRPGEPVGLYNYNGSGLETRSQINAVAIIYHELVPGHHFHIARQNENQSLPAIRREAMEMGVYNEGWAEYASGLAREMGLYDDPHDLYGRLVHERFTAQRLVVDTGMNLLGWSLDRGREYMRRYTMESETQVATETLRYSTDLPGQALCYRLGYLKMAELRRKSEQALGPRFDIRAFHEAILGPGALPLAALAQHIDHFIDQNR